MCFFSIFDVPIRANNIKISSILIENIMLKENILIFSLISTLNIETKPKL